MLNDKLHANITQLHDKLVRYLAYSFFIGQYRHRRFKYKCLVDKEFNRSVLKAVKSLIDSLLDIIVYDDEQPTGSGLISAENVPYVVREALYRECGDLEYLENLPELMKDDIRDLQIYYAVNYAGELPQEFLPNVIDNINGVKYILKQIDLKALEFVNRLSSEYGLFIYDLIQNLFTDFTPKHFISIDELKYCFLRYPLKEILFYDENVIHKFLSSKIKIRRFYEAIYKLQEIDYTNSDIVARSTINLNLVGMEVPICKQILEVFTPTKFHRDSIVNRKYGLMLWDYCTYFRHDNRCIESQIKKLYELHTNTYQDGNKYYIDFKRQCFKWLANTKDCINTGTITSIK